MHITNLRIERLRDQMRAQGMAAYLVPTSDYHASEYVGAHFQARQFLSGFTGSAGTLVVTLDDVRLWTDGRYFLQAEEQLSGTCVKLCPMGEPGTPTIEAYLLEVMPEQGILGMDGRTVDAARCESLEKQLVKKHGSIHWNLDLVGDIWQERPPLCSAPVFLLEERYAGKSAGDKLRALRQAMAEQNVNVHILTALDDIAWLFNIRGADVPFNPVTLAYGVIEDRQAYLFLDDKKLDNALRAYFASLDVTLCPYGDIYDFCKRYTSADTILLNKKLVNQALFQAVSQAVILNGVNPTTMMKAVKNPIEQENLRRAHQKDAVAVIRFLYRVKNGLLPEPLTETDAAAAIDSLRMEQEGCLGPSFDTIAGFGAHGAIVHYHAEPSNQFVIKGNGLLLVDSGGQYLEGTTDITRTIAIGTPSEREKRDFTLVLKGMLRLMAARFPQGATGRHLDVLAREPLWAEGLDYKHGTGHGIGAFLCVHEGPVSINWKNAAPLPLEAGMVLSDEPGLYQEGAYGIRHENQLLCVEAGASAYGSFLTFESLTLAPFDRDAILPQLLNNEETAWLNAYHQRVYGKIAPLLSPAESAWLRQATLPLEALGRACE